MLTPPRKIVAEVGGWQPLPALQVGQGLQVVLEVSITLNRTALLSEQVTEVRLTVRKGLGDKVVNALGTSTAPGVWVFALAPSQTRNIAVGRYAYDITALTGGGERAAANKAGTWQVVATPGGST